MNGVDQTTVGLAVTWVMFCLVCFVASCFEPHACDNSACPHLPRRRR